MQNLQITIRRRIKMSFELIDNIEEKYPIEHFTRDSVIRVNIAPIVNKIRNIIINLKNQIEELELRIEKLEEK